MGPLAHQLLLRCLRVLFDPKNRNLCLRIARPTPRAVPATLLTRPRLRRHVCRSSWCLGVRRLRRRQVSSQIKEGVGGGVCFCSESSRARRALKCRMSFLRPHARNSSIFYVYKSHSPRTEGTLRACAHSSIPLSEGRAGLIPTRKHAHTHTNNIYKQYHTHTYIHISLSQYIYIYMYIHRNAIA